MGIPNYTPQSTATRGSRQKPTPDSGYYLVDTTELCKTFLLGNGKNIKPRGDGAWYLPYTFENGWSGFVFVNHVLNDDGTPRRMDDKERERTEMELNTLCASAGVDMGNLAGCQNTKIAVKWQDATFDAFKAGRKGRAFVVTREEYDKAIAEGWTVKDIEAPQEVATQAAAQTEPAYAYTDDEVPF